MPHRPIRLAALFSLTLAACAASAPPSQTDAEMTARRVRMVDTQIRLRGVSDERVLRAMLKVPRHPCGGACTKESTLPFPAQF